MLGKVFLGEGITCVSDRCWAPLANACSRDHFSHFNEKKRNKNCHRLSSILEKGSALHAPNAVNHFPHSPVWNTQGYGEIHILFSSDCTTWGNLVDFVLVYSFRNMWIKSLLSEKNMRFTGAVFSRSQRSIRKNLREGWLLNLSENPSGRTRKPGASGAFPKLQSSILHMRGSERST